MNLDEVDGRFGEAWAGTSPDRSHINIEIGRRPEARDHTALRVANRLAARNAIADALQTDHREGARELIAGRETARNRFYRGE
jgi:hypothetical protein